MSTSFADGEKALLQQVASGNEVVFGNLFHAWRDKLYFFLLGITNSSETAEDSVQEVFLKLWKNRATLPEVENFSAYLYSMARNHAISGIRRMAQETMILSELRQRTIAAGNVVDEELQYKHLKERLHEIVSKLPKQQRLVYTLSREDGLCQQEIARQLNITISTVQNHMTQALRNIRQQISFLYPETACLLFFMVAHLL